MKKVIEVVQFLFFGIKMNLRCGSYTKLDICEECWKKLRLHGGK